MRLLNQRQEKILAEERQILNELQETLSLSGIKQEDDETLARSIRQMDDLFLLVVVGEFNAGKSTFINALLGKRYLAEGVTPTTTHINILRHAEVQTSTQMDENTLLVTAPSEILREISIVDTPGTNAVIREHEIITAQFVPRADIVIFVTSVDRPFTESERIFLEGIRNWGKKLVVVINKSDALENEEDLQKIVSFVEQNVEELLQVSPPIFPLSARQAMQAREGQPQLWQESHFEALEKHIHETLDEEGRLQLKLLNPLGVGLRLTTNTLEIVNNRLELLRADTETLVEIERLQNLYQKDMREDFHYRLADMENVLSEMEKRGLAFFDETLRVLRVPDLFKKEMIQKSFEEEVILDVPKQIEKRVDDLIDWMVGRDFRQWEAVMSLLSERRRVHQDHLPGDSSGSSFHYDRQRLIEAVGKEANRVVETYDKEKEARLMAEEAQAAVAAAAVLEAGAVGLGALVAILASTVTVDVTGVLFAGVMAVLGLVVIPNRRRKAKQTLSQKISSMREQLINALKESFEKEIGAHLERIEEAINPYSRFVFEGRNSLTTTQQALQRLEKNMLAIKEQITEMNKAVPTVPQEEENETQNPEN